jgi:hypothetical protein
MTLRKRKTFILSATSLRIGLLYPVCNTQQVTSYDRRGGSVYCAHTTTTRAINLGYHETGQGIMGAILQAGHAGSGP